MTKIFEQYEKEKDGKSKSKLKRKMKNLTTTIGRRKAFILKEYISEIPYLKGKEKIVCIDLKYNKDSGLMLEVDKNYDLEERFCD